MANYANPMTPAPADYTQVAMSMALHYSQSQAQSQMTDPDATQPITMATPVPVPAAAAAAAVLAAVAAPVAMAVDIPPQSGRGSPFITSALPAGPQGPAGPSGSPVPPAAEPVQVPGAAPLAASLVVPSSLSLAPVIVPTGAGDLAPPPLKRGSPGAASPARAASSSPSGQSGRSTLAGKKRKAEAEIKTDDVKVTAGSDDDSDAKKEADDEGEEAALAGCAAADSEEDADADDVDADADGDADGDEAKAADSKSKAGDKASGKTDGSGGKGSKSKSKPPSEMRAELNEKFNAHVQALKTRPELTYSGQKWTTECATFKTTTVPAILLRTFRPQKGAYPEKNNEWKYERRLFVMRDTPCDVNDDLEVVVAPYNNSFNDRSTLYTSYDHDAIARLAFVLRVIEAKVKAEKASKADASSDEGSPVYGQPVSMQLFVTAFQLRRLVTDDADKDGRIPAEKKWALNAYNKVMDAVAEDGQEVLKTNTLAWNAAKQLYLGAKLDQDTWASSTPLYSKYGVQHEFKTNQEYMNYIIRSIATISSKTLTAADKREKKQQLAAKAAAVAAEAAAAAAEAEAAGSGKKAPKQKGKRASAGKKAEKLVEAEWVPLYVPADKQGVDDTTVLTETRTIYAHMKRVFASARTERKTRVVKSKLTEQEKAANAEAAARKKKEAAQQKAELLALLKPDKFNERMDHVESRIDQVMEALKRLTAVLDRDSKRQKVVPISPFDTPKKPTNSAVAVAAGAVGEASPRPPPAAAAAAAAAATMAVDG